MKIGAFGEVMLRVSPPEYYLLEQSDTLRMTFTGTGVNLLSNLAHFDLSTALLTNLPDNRLGMAAKAKLRQLGIKTDFIGQKHQHLGSYFAEQGFGSRPTYVTYQNRLSSSFGLSLPSDYPIAAFIQSVDLIHICGIALSLTDNSYKTAVLLAQEAQKQGKKVCFDFNFRPSLNTEPGKKALMKQRYEEILPYCDLVIGSSRDLVALLQRTGDPTTFVGETTLIQKFMQDYQITWFAGTKRYFEADQQWLSGRLFTPSEAFETAPKRLQVLDRIGAGDAYAAGILLGYAENWTLTDTAEFAITNAMLAHTIPGDVPLTTRAQVQQVMENPTVDLIR